MDGKRWLKEHLLKIVDEVRTTHPVNARDLVGARRLEVDVGAAEIEALGVEEPLIRHPLQRRRSQVRPRFVVVRVFGLVAHDEDRDITVPARADELFHALDELRAAHERSVRQRLQLLPFNLAIRQLTNAVADGSLRPVGALLDQSAVERRFVHQRIVADNRIVEIYSDRTGHRPLCPTATEGPAASGGVVGSPSTIRQASTAPARYKVDRLPT